MKSNPNPDFDVYDPLSYNHQYANINGHRYHFVEQGNSSAPLIIFVHGFPELWYSWRHQIKYFSELGFHVVAIDKPGYGETEVGKDLKNFSFQSTCSDLKELVLNVLSYDKAIFIGHDWGAQVTWMMCLLHPELVEAVVGLSVPFFPPPKKYLSLSEVVAKKPVVGYQLALAEGDVKEFDEKIADFLEAFWVTEYKDYNKSILFTPPGTSLLKQYYDCAKTKTKIPEKQFLTYLESKFKIKGCEGPTNWYRTSLINYKDFYDSKLNPKIKQKSLCIVGDKDFTNLGFETSKLYFNQLTIMSIKGGHWIHLVNHHEINSLIKEWLLSFMNLSQLKSNLKLNTKL